MLGTDRRAIVRCYPFGRWEFETVANNWGVLRRPSEICMLIAQTDRRKLDLHGHLSFMAQALPEVCRSCTFSGVGMSYGPEEDQLSQRGMSLLT